MNKSILIKNASSIVTCDANDRVYYDSDILIEGPKIIRIGKAIQETTEEVIDASGKFVYPGDGRLHVVPPEGDFSGGYRLWSGDGTGNYSELI